jgi:hypothetical protein
MSVRATGPAVDLSALTFPEQVYEGDTATANLTITNVGDRPMPASLVVLGSDPSVEGLDDPFPVPALAVGGRWQASMPFLPARDEPVFLPGAFAVLDTSKDGHVQADEGVYVALRPDAPSQGFEHPAGGGTLGAGDVRLNATGRASGSQVVNGSKERDLGSGPLLPLDGRLWCTDLDGDGRCHPGDTMYLNLMDEGGLQQVVSSGDLRLTARGALHAGSRVLANEADTGADLVPWGGWALAFADRNGNGAFDAAEPMYLDRGDHAVGPEDVRLTILTGARGVVVAPFGSWVAAGDLDDGTRLAPGPFGTTVVDGVLGPVSVGGIWVVEDGSLPGLQIPTASLFVRTARLQATAPAAFNAAPGESLDLGVPPGAFQVANLGNAPEEIRILAEASSGHVALPGGDLVGLAPGESRIVPVHVDLPLSAGAATVELRLTAWLEHHPATQATAVVQVALPDLTPPSVAFAGMPAVWDPGRPLLVALNASDDVGVASVAVVAQTAGGTPVPAAARLDDDGLWRVEMALSPGNYTLRALATDVSNRTAGAIPVAVEIRQVPPPDLLRLVPADGAVVWPSDPVLVSLHDPTRALEVDSQGSDTLFLHGNLTGLAAGRHTLAFAAVNGAGRSWERTITVNSAPSGAAPSSAPPAKDSPAGAVPLFGLALLLLAAGRRPRKPWDTK